MKTDEEGKSYINFKDASALRSLTETLLLEDWDLQVDLREDRLCPTVSPAWSRWCNADAKLANR